MSSEDVVGSPQFGKLVEAQLRDAWPHEAQRFTPWLVKNLDHIGEAIGMRLEAEGAEVQVGRFWADILARNPIDDTRVLIENQLEAGDHNHLGQILTYLAGLDAKTVVWIASSFTDEHLSALKWLNQHTEDGFSFFAVKVKVVRIGDSPFAPIFEVVEKPNEWDRQVHSAAVASGTRSELSEKRFAFWQAFCDRLPAAAERDGGPSYWSNRWRVLTNPDLIVSLYLSKNSVGVFARGPQAGDHKETRELFRQREAELEARFGVPMGNSTWAFFPSEIKGDYTDVGQRNDLIDRLAELTDIYEKALREVFS